MYIAKSYLFVAQIIALIKNNSKTQRIIFFFLFFLTFQLTLQAQTFEVNIDTLFLNIKKIARPATRVNLTHALKYNDKYYCFFKEDGLYSFKIDARYFLIISSNGTILNNIEVPQEIENTTYFDFFIRNDSLLAKTYMDHESFYFDLNKFEWNKIKEIDDRVYEDSNFAITYLDFGEWGETTWFIDKQTQKEYILGSNGTTVNLLDGKYYLTNGVEIIEIEDPRNLKQCESDYYYQLVEKERKSYEGSNSLVGSKIIYKDTTFSQWSFKAPLQTIITTFFSNNQLYQLYSDSISTYIGKIENERLIPIQKIGKKYSPSNWYYSYRGENPDKNRRFLKFSEDNNTFGFIEIKNNKINIHYLKHNLDSLKYLGYDGFEKLLNLISVNSVNLSFEQVNYLEIKLGGIDMKTERTGISHNGYYPKVYDSMKVKTKEFIKVEDKNISQKTEYLYITSEKSVKSIFLEWSTTELYNESNSFNPFNDEKPEIIEQFKRKQNELIKIITSQFGLEPKKKNRGKDYNELTWISKSGLEIILYGSDTFNGEKEIRMIINLKKL
ncbi:MAG: hypothetical protein ACOYO1_09670 [Bacteroidales bacterium]